MSTLYFRVLSRGGGGTKLPANAVFDTNEFITVFSCTRALCVNGQRARQAGLMKFKGHFS